MAKATICTTTTRQRLEEGSFAACKVTAAKPSGTAPLMTKVHAIPAQGDLLQKGSKLTATNTGLHAFRAEYVTEDHAVPFRNILKIQKKKEHFAFAIL